MKNLHLMKRTAAALGMFVAVSGAAYAADPGFPAPTGDRSLVPSGARLDRIFDGGCMLTEGVASINGTAIFKNAPHPNTALLFARWIASQEGQKVMAQGGRTPAHPKVEPLDKTRTEKIYPISVADIKEYPKYEKIWKEIFKLR